MAASAATYLNFNGNAEEAFNFYKSVFGGNFGMLMRFKDVSPEHQMGESNGDKIMHVSLPLAQGTSLLGSDVPEMYGKVAFGNNVSISLSVESRDEADKLFNALSDGGKQTMLMEDTFWGSYFGMLTDKFAIQWMVGYDAPQQ